MQFAPKPSDIEKRIKRIACSDGAAFSRNAWDRIDGREISDLDAIRVLKFGSLKGKIEAGENAGEWKAEMTLPRNGGRVMGVVTLLLRNERLFIKTVEWEY